MAYQEIIAPATPAAVIDAIRAFAEANGWTVLRNNLVGNNRTVTLKRPETDHVHIYNLDLLNVYMRMSIAYAAGTAPDSMADRSQRATCNVQAGPYTKLYMFAGTSPTAHVYWILEGNSAGMYYHGAFGMTEKLDAWTGGTYVDGTYWSNTWPTSTQRIDYYSNAYTSALFGNDHTTDTSPTSTSYATRVSGGMRCDIPADSRANTWAGFSQQPLSSTSAADTAFPVNTGISAAGDPGAANPSTNSAAFVGNPLTTLVQFSDDNYFSNRSVFYPIEFTVGRVGGYGSPVGRPPNIRLCNISKFTDGQEITIGSDVWKIFPMFKRGQGAGPSPYSPGSGQYGYAYLKTP